MPKRASDKKQTSNIKHQTSSYVDVAVFMVTLFLANAFWKWMIHGDDGVSSQSVVTCFGLDVTAIFDAYAKHIASVVYTIVHWFRDSLYLVNETTMRFTDGGGTRIVWSCTPIKQMFIWICLILTTPTSFSAAEYRSRRSDQRSGLSVKRSFCAAVVSKLWFIPLGMVFIHVVNIARICIITSFMEFHPDWFEVLHTYIFKYLFYGLMFLFWVLYVEKVRK